MLVRLVRVDDVHVVLGTRAVLLQVRQEAQARVADRDVHEAAPERDPLGRRGAGGRRQDREVAGPGPPPDHAHQTLAQHGVVSDAGGLTLHGGEGLTGPRGEVVGEDRLGEDVVERRQLGTHGRLLLHPCRGGDEALLGRPRLAHGIAGETPDVVGVGAGVGAEPLAARDLRDTRQVFVGVPGMVVYPEHRQLIGGNAGDTQMVDHDERPDASADGDEWDVDDRDAGAGNHVVGPDRRIDQLGGQVAHPGELLTLEDTRCPASESSGAPRWGQARREVRSEQRRSGLPAPAGHRRRLRRQSR